MSLADALQLKYQFQGKDPQLLQQSIQILGRAVELQPDWYVPYHRRALASLTLGDMDVGMRDIDQAMSIAPTEIDLWALKIEVLMAQGKLEEARTLAYDALTYFQEFDVPALSLAEVFYVSEQWELALEFYSMLTQDALSQAPVRFAVGYAQENIGNLEEAVGGYMGALQIDPTLVAAYTRMAIVEATRGNHDSARKVLAALLKRSPGNPEAINLLAEIHLQTGQKSRARGLWMYLAKNSDVEAYRTMAEQRIASLASG